MSKAVIIDNKPYCGICNKLLTGTAENYYLVKDDDGSHFAFTRKCPSCRKSLTYYVSTDFNKRYLIEEGE